MQSPCETLSKSHEMTVCIIIDIIIIPCWRFSAGSVQDRKVLRKGKLNHNPLSATIDLKTLRVLNNVVPCQPS